MVTRERMKEAEKGGEREAEGSRKPKKSALYVSLCSSTDVDTDVAVCRGPEKKVWEEVLEAEDARSGGETILRNSDDSWDQHDQLLLKLP